MSTILVTDDDETCRDSIKKVLESEGHVVEEAADVDSALIAIELRNFDLIVCDYRMPGKTGLDLLVELKRRSCPAPVLIMSAFADDETENTVRQLGGIELLRKPFRRRELIDRTSKAVGG